MLDYDEIVVFVVDENAKETKHGPVQWSREVEVGKHMLLRLQPETPELFHVLAFRPGEGRGRYVRVVAAGEIDGDGDDVLVACRECNKRVVFERLPSGDGEPRRFRLPLDE